MDVLVGYQLHLRKSHQTVLVRHNGLLEMLLRFSRPIIITLWTAKHYQPFPVLGLIAEKESDTDAICEIQHCGISAGASVQSFLINTSFLAVSRK
jgi:hypothetical protein